ncbi:type VI secretion system baseplate subunit TssK [Sphingomonas sp. NCPPB 2930]
MTWYHKVVWSEGMFLRPQHFQQLERHAESFAHGRSLAAEGHFWGFRSLTLDTGALAVGRIALQQAQGVLPDGTPFDFPARGAMPPALTVGRDCRDERILLALPMHRSGTDEVAFEETSQSTARYRVTDGDTIDSNDVRGETAPIQLGELRLRLVRESQLPGDWIGIGAVKVAECRADHQVVLDSHYLPPHLSVGQQPVLARFLDELHGLLHQRGEALAARLGQSGRSGTGEVGEFLLLGLVNRHQPELAHLARLAVLHPERLVSHLLGLAGDLATYTREDRRPAAFPAYDHDDLAACFQPLMAELRRALSMVLEQNAVQIELHDRAHGVRVALIQDTQLLRSASFVMAVHAEAPDDVVRHRFPSQVKIGPVERIRDLVNLHLPGVALQPLAVVPRQIPYHAGYIYFELDTHNDLWKQLERSGGMAMHIAGDFPGLVLEFWAIRNS